MKIKPNETFDNYKAWMVTMMYSQKPSMFMKIHIF